MNKICTDINQSMKLIELGLDVNTSDMYYPNRTDIQYQGALPIGMKHGNSLLAQEIPAWSLSALLDLMPKIHGERPKLDTGSIQTEKYYVEYPYHESTKNDWYSTKLCDSAVDACYEMIIKLNELNLL